MNFFRDSDICLSDARLHSILFQLVPEAGTLVLGSRRSQDAKAHTAPYILRLDADFASGGAWAGVDRLVELAYLGLNDAGANDIIAQHVYELYMVLPQHRMRLRPPNLCLTDTADSAEKTRYHQLDRAYRIINGIVGLLLRWKRLLHDHESWLVFVDNFDDAEHLARRFFGELVRRAAGENGITVILRCSSGHAPGSPGVQAVEAAHWMTDLNAVPALPGTEQGDVDMSDSIVVSDICIVSEYRYVRELEWYSACGDMQGAARTALKLFVIYCTHGYYHEARRLMDVFLPFFDDLTARDEAQRVYYIGRMNICLSMIGDPDAALRLIGDEGAAPSDQPHLLAAIEYSLGMHYLRYAQARDLQLSETHLLHAAALLRDTANHHDPFQKVFIDNGLAFLRARQGRHQEALELCRAGYAFLTGEVGDDVHRLHRSVLLYNVAQVLVMLGSIEEGIGYFRQSIEMDPHYSEYHNEIGNLLQEQALYQDAVDEYALAIGCSAPYPEVYFNKAICHLQLGEFSEALFCFETTLELNPSQPQAYALQADVLREMDRADDALAYYDSAISLGFDGPAVRVNRAVLNYGQGRYGRALADMDQAIAQEPGNPDHYENRAAIHTAMDEPELSRRDLARAELCREAA